MSSPPPERRLRPRVVTRTFPDPAVLHTATRFSTSLRSRRPPLLACAIGEDPPLARPRPRELVVRLEEDLAHAFLGQAPPADFCNTTRRAGTPFEHSILAREFGEAAAPFSSSLARTTLNPRYSPSFSACADRYHGENEPRGRRRLSPLQPARAEGGRAKDSPFDRRVSLLEPFPRAPGSPHRCFGGAGDSPSRRGHGLGPLPPPPREGRRFPKDRGALLRSGTHRAAVLAATRLLGARREIAPASDAPDRPSVTPPLTFP